MTLRTCIVLLLSTAPLATALAHDGDHSGMTEAAVQLHHLALPLALVVVAATVIAYVLLRRSVRLGAKHGADRR